MAVTAMYLKIIFVICFLAGGGNAQLDFFSFTAQFRLYTRANPTDFEIVTIQNSTSSTFNPALETTFIIHGWNQAPNAGNILNMKTAILGKYDMNVFIVNWAKLGQQLYNFARAAVSKVADDVKDMILHLNQARSQPLGMMHSVGFSLGAHIAGIAGKRVGGMMANIIALDPAYPLFNIWATHERVNVGDAQYVQVLHCSGDTLAFMPPLGDYDVYANGGRQQPGCSIFDLMCSHNKTQVYFANAVNDPASSYAYKCGSFWEIAFGFCNKVGDNVPLIQFKPTTKYFGAYWGKV